ncbi:disease resistance protein RGA5-like isoform X2 [Triticum urartu]|nr:disease resistance protein RGA5-like isoform X2 [Triticum urartu]
MAGPEPGGVVWQSDGEIDMDLLPPISASMGALGSLPGKLDALKDSELMDEIRKLVSRLLKLSKPQDPRHAARIWMNEARELSYEMVNCVDADADWIDKMSRIFKPRVKEANGRYDRYKLESVRSRAAVLAIPMVVGDGGRKPDLLVGLHANGGAFETLRKNLIDRDEQLKVLSVVGVGGIGKTTVAKELWREHKPGHHFRCRAFVRTAKKPDMRRILRSILAQVRPDQPPDANEVHELIHDINEHLKHKRYFIIIDDLWDTSVWDVAARAFPKGNDGSRIITTTEIEDVALACCSYQSKYMLKMEHLSESHSKELFTSAVFGSGEQHSRQVDEVSDEIIRRCAGLPQAIISISSVLASHGEANTVENWEQIQKSFLTNTTSDEILKEVLIFCYNRLPSCVQTCLLHLSVYPENYVILKEDITKQWVAEGLISAPAEKGKMEIAGSYFDMLVSMGMIQHIDVDYGNDVVYYAVHHMVHDIITSKSREENFVTVIDYSQRAVRFSNMVSRLSLQFGSATYATTPARIGLSQMRSLAYTGLMSCLPSISEFKLLRVLILHIWADQPSTGVDLECISGLLLLRYLQATCNSTVHLPEQMQRLKHLETLEINAKVAAIPSDIVHLRNLLHLRLGGGTELPDVTGVLTNDTLNPPSAATLLDDWSSSPDSLNTMELLPPICRIPKWIGQLTNLCILKVVVRELLRNDIGNMKGLPSLTLLSLHVQGGTTELIGFASGAFSALVYFEFRCGELRLMFQEGAMPNLQRIKLGFNVRRGKQYVPLLSGIENLSNVQEISWIIGAAPGADEHDFQAAKSAFMKAVSKLCSKVSVKRADMVEEECDPAEKQREEDASSSVKSEQPAIPKQESEEDIKQNAGGSLLSGIENLSSVQEISGITGVATGAEEHDIQAAESAFMKSVSEKRSKVSIKRASMLEQGYGPAQKQHVIREKDASSSIKSEQPVIPKQESGGNYQFIQRRRNTKETANMVQGLSGNRELRGGAVGEANKEEERQNSLWKGYISMNFKLHEIEDITNNFADYRKVGSGGYGDVYRATYQGEEIAVKKLHQLQGLDDKQFHSEFLDLHKVRHQNVVRLIGYCYETRSRQVNHNGELVFVKIMERVLCFEYMQGGSLDKHITEESCELDWPICYKIIRGTCEGLNYLHSAQEKPIFHLDIKPANILLDKSMTPKIADLGLSKLVFSTLAHKREIVNGTHGYMPPEYVERGFVSKKFDVFSLGVVIIKMMAGNMGYFCRAEKSPKDFIEHVTENWTRRLQEKPGYSSHEIDILRVSTTVEIALRCVARDRNERPSIRDIVHELAELEAKIEKMSLASDLPKDLTFQRSCNTNIMSVDPPTVLRFLFELRKEASCCLQLTNKTGGFIAFNILIDENKYSVRPSQGTIPPFYSRHVGVTLRAQEAAPPYMRCGDLLLVQSTGVSQDLVIDYEELFKTAMVNEVKLRIAYVTLDQ